MLNRAVEVRPVFHNSAHMEVQELQAHKFYSKLMHDGRCTKFMLRFAL